MTARILVSVLAWCDVEHTRACLHRLLADAPASVDVILTDNGSPAEIASALVELAARFPERVRLVRRERNLGFAGGHVAALEECGVDAYEFALLLNNDALLDSATLRRLVDAADAAGADLAGPAIVYADDPERVWQGGGRMVDALAHLRNPWLGTPVTALPRDAIPVDFVSGCAMLIRTRLLREIGSLDTAYVYSVEDVDLCTRARRAGRTVLFVPSCVVVHAHAASVGGWDGPFAVRHALWGRAYYAGKFGNLPTRWASWSFLAAVILPVKVARRTGRTSRLRLLCDGLATIKRGARRRPLPAPRGPEDTRT